jgi:hypothetical protein
MYFKMNSALVGDSIFINGKLRRSRMSSSASTESSGYSLRGNTKDRIDQKNDWRYRRRAIFKGVGILRFVRASKQSFNALANFFCDPIFYFATYCVINIRLIELK